MRVLALGGAVLLAEVEVKSQGRAEALVRSSRAEAAAAAKAGVECADGSQAASDAECPDAVEAAVAALLKGAELLAAGGAEYLAPPQLAPWATVLAHQHLARGASGHGPTGLEPASTEAVQVTYIRHGFSCANANRDLFAKRSIWAKLKAEEYNVMRYRDPPLTDCGVAASKRAGLRLAKAFPQGFHFVGSSSLRRAVETAAGEFDGSGAEARIRDGELHFPAGGSEDPRIAVLPFILEGSPGEDNKPDQPDQQRAKLALAADLDARPAYGYLEEARALYDLAMVADAKAAEFKAAQKEAARELSQVKSELLTGKQAFHDADGVLDQQALDWWESSEQQKWVSEREAAFADETLLRRAGPALHQLAEQFMPAASRRDTVWGQLSGLAGNSGWRDTPSFVHAEQFLGARVVPDLRKVLQTGTTARIAVVSHSITIKDYIHEGHVKDLPQFQPCRDLLTTEPNSKGKTKARKPFNNEAITVTYEFDPTTFSLQPRACHPTLMPDQVEELFVDFPAAGPGAGAEPMPTAVNLQELSRCQGGAFVEMADEENGGTCRVDHLEI